MLSIICGTNIPQSRIQRTCEFLKELYAEKGLQTKMMDLASLPLNELNGTTYFKDKQPNWMKQWNEEIPTYKGFLIVAPEFNGSYPGALKLWIDHWWYPEAFKNRKIALIGLGGGVYGGLRPADHLQDVFTYGESFILPQRVYLRTVDAIISKDGRVVDEASLGLLRTQRDAFINFIS